MYSYYFRWFFYFLQVNGKPMKLQLWDTGGMERVASITSSYYKYSEAAILVFALDRPDTFHVLAQHLLVSFNSLTVYLLLSKVHFTDLLKDSTT